MGILRKVKGFLPKTEKEKRKIYAAKQHPETRVLLTGFTQCSNLGDVVISDCTTYLLRKAMEEAGLKKLKVTPLDIRKQKDAANLNKVRNSDLVVFPGGGFIKYKQENFPKNMGRIVSRAEHYGIPIMYNAMGVEGYDAQDERCMTIQNHLLGKSCRYITSRDYADFLNETYLKNSSVKARRVADPAVYSQEVYGVSRDESSQVIGLGVARSNLFVDYGVPLTGEELLEIWSGIIRLLDEKGVKWKLFTNGLKADEDFLTELLCYIGREDEREEISVKAPETAEELVKTIAAFKGIIATRMHANIIAFALSVPSVAFIWNDKLRFFGESIGCSHRYLEYTEIKDAQFVVSALEKALEEGYEAGTLEREKNSAYDSVKTYFIPFAKNLLDCRRRDMTKVPLVCYGLPNFDSDKLNWELFETKVDYYVTDDESLVGTECLGKPVLSPQILYKNRRKKPFVLISTTVDYYPCAAVLESYGYKEKRDYVNMHAYKRYVFKKGDVFVDKPQITEAK